MSNLWTWFSVMAVSLYLLMTSINCNTAFFYALFSAACCPDFCRRPLEGRGRRKLTQSQLKTLRVWAIESGRIEAQQELGNRVNLHFSLWHVLQFGAFVGTTNAKEKCILWPTSQRTHKIAGQIAQCKSTRTSKRADQLCTCLRFTKLFLNYYLTIIKADFPTFSLATHSNKIYCDSPTHS